MDKPEILPMDKELIRDLSTLLNEARGTRAEWAAAQVVIWACSPRFVIQPET